MRHYVLISFSTQPNSGSERGVGWAFLTACIELLTRFEITIHVILDVRDREEILKQLGELETPRLVLHFVDRGKLFRFATGDSKTRFSYLTWVTRARGEIRKILAKHDVAVIHQVTFASFILPNAIPKLFRNSYRTKKIWGPASIAITSAESWPIRKKSLGLRNALLKTISKIVPIQFKSLNLIIANNQHTANLIPPEKLDLEPNIFLDLEHLDNMAESTRDTLQLLTVGALIPRKRPWLSIILLTRPEMQEFRLNFIGDGPLKNDLQSLSEELGVSNRVRFLGQLPHTTTLRQIAECAVLLHPSSREGSPWVIGEASSLGTPCIVAMDSGSDTTLALSNSQGAVVDYSNDQLDKVANAVISLSKTGQPVKSHRWDKTRATSLLAGWWNLA